jgi:hypothetical protein
MVLILIVVMVLFLLLLLAVLVVFLVVLIVLIVVLLLLLLLLVLINSETDCSLSRGNLCGTIFGLGDGVPPTHAADDNVRESLILVLRPPSTGKHLTVHLSSLHSLAKMAPSTSLESVHGTHLVMLTRGHDVCVKRIVSIFSMFRPLIACLILLSIED